MAAMTGRAGTQRTIQIQSADPGIRPGLRRRTTFAVDLHRSPVALQTARVDRRGAADHLTHDVIQRSEDLPALGMVRRLLLGHFLFIPDCPLANF